MEQNIGQCLGERKLIGFLVPVFTSMHYNKINMNKGNMIP